MPIPGKNNRGRVVVLDPHRIWDLSVLAIVILLATWCGFSNLTSLDIKNWLIAHLLIAVINKDPWVVPGFMASIILAALPEQLKHLALIAVVAHVGLAVVIMENPPFSRMASMILQLSTSNSVFPILLSLIHYLRPAYSCADHLRAAVSVTGQRLDPGSNKLHETLRNYATAVLSRGSIRGMRNYLTTTRELLVNEDPKSDLIEIIRQFEAETMRDQIWSTVSNVATVLAFVAAMPSVVANHSGVSNLREFDDIVESQDQEIDDLISGPRSKQPSSSCECIDAPAAPAQPRWQVSQITNSEAIGPGDSYHAVVEDNINRSKNLLKWVREYFVNESGWATYTGPSVNLTMDTIHRVDAYKFRPNARILRVNLICDVFKPAHPLTNSLDRMPVAAFTVALDKFMNVSNLACSINETTGSTIDQYAPCAIKAPRVGQEIKDDAATLFYSTADPHAYEVILFRFISVYLVKLADNLIDNYVIDPHKDAHSLFHRMFTYLAFSLGSEHQVHLLESIKLMQRTSAKLDTLVRTALAGVTLGPNVSFVTAVCN